MNNPNKVIEEVKNINWYSKPSLTAIERLMSLYTGPQYDEYGYREILENDLQELKRILK